MKRILTLCVFLEVLLGGASLVGAATYDFDEGDVDVATTTTEVRPANGKRTVLVVQNNSDTTVWCTKNNTAAVVGSGTQVFPGSADFYDAVVPSGAVNCIHAGTGLKKVHWIQNK